MVNMIINKAKKPEILSPAGDFEKFLFALAYGADAVYLGGENFGLRVKSNNFSLDEIAKAVSIAKEKGVKVYVTVNIFAHNEDIEALPNYLKSLNEIKPHGLIISDLGVFALAQEFAPNIPIHISTQANSVNYRTVEQWQKFGAERVVLGRELSLAEIEEITSKTSAELEIFVHGAMCMSYSGRCLLSNYLTGRDANHGACTHPCRWKYALVEAERPDEYLPIEEDNRGSYIMNSKDLNLLSYIPQFIDYGLDSLKIEGRVKSAYYVAVVTKVYREAVDVAFNDKEEFFKSLPQWQNELKTVSHREYTQGFFGGKPNAEDYRYDSSSYVREYDFIAVVRGYDQSRKCLILEQRNNFKVGETLEILSPVISEQPQSINISKMYNEKFEEIDVAPHAQMMVYLPYVKGLPPLTILRRKR
ncbi:MAG: U32 family peptidase [Clostridiales bacterium]